MADLANVLLRSIARAFYAPEQVVILDAVLLHSALRDDDLALLMGGQQTKHLRKTCSKLVEDGLLTVHSRAEQRLGATRTFNKDYYYVNTHRAIDVVKYRVKRIHKAVEKKYGQAPEEKKEYSCPICNSFYTQLEVLDNVGPTGFVCKKCGGMLDPIEDDGTAGAAGHEVQSRLNQQMAVFEKMLAEIDNAEVPEQDFDVAIAKALPVKRDESINPGSRSEPVATGAGGPATVRGRHIGEERVEISLLDEDERKAEEAAEAARRAKLAEQNQLPSWHTASTVGLSSSRTNGAAGAATSADANGVIKGDGDEDEEKKASALMRGEEEKEDSKAALDQIFATLHQDTEDEDDDSSDDEDDDNDNEESGEEDDEGDEEPAAKRVRIAEPESNGTPMKSEDESNESS